MVYFSASDGGVAVGHEVLRDGHCVFENGGFSPGLRVVIDARGRGEDSGHKACSRGVAGRGRAMGVCEEDAPCSEAVEIRGLDIGMAAQAADPVVQIVDCHEQDVGLSGLLRVRSSSGTGTTGQYECCCADCCESQKAATINGI